MNVNNQSKTSDRDLQNKNNKIIHFRAIAGNVVIWHSMKKWQRIFTMATQDQTYKDQTNIQTTEPIRYPPSVSPVRPPVLTQQITAYFQLSQEAWNKHSSQMSEMATN